MADPTLIETILATFTFSVIVLFFLQVAWGLGWPLFFLVVRIVIYSLFAVSMIVTLIYDVPVSVVQGLRGHHREWKLTLATCRVWNRITGLLTPGMPREIDVRGATHLQDLLRLSPTGFEVAVADLLTEHGFTNMKQCGGAGDLSVDLTGLNSKGRTVAVQCKRYDLHVKVGSRDIQQFIGMTTTHHKVDHGIFVTTSSYTKPAIELAKRHKIELIDGARLAEMLLEHVPELTEEDNLLAELEGRSAHAR